MEHKIREHAQAKENNIHSLLKKSIAQSMTEQEFTEKYGSGYEVFAKSDIAQFVHDAVDTEDMSFEDAVAEVKTLNPVLIKANGIDELSTRYVRKIEEENQQ
jgi:hypothetical protein